MTVAPLALVAVVLMSPGQVSARRGVTVTVKLHDAERPPIDAVHITVITPSGKLAPDGGLQDTLAFGGTAVGAG